MTAAHLARMNPPAIVFGAMKMKAVLLRTKPLPHLLWSAVSFQRLRATDIPEVYSGCWRKASYATCPLQVGRVARSDEAEQLFGRVRRLAANTFKAVTIAANRQEVPENAGVLLQNVWRV